MDLEEDRALTGTVRARSHPLIGARSDLDPLLEMIGQRSIVLLGEATHGTHEFYEIRSEITKRLIEEKGFTALVLEADWPDAQLINQYIQGKGGDASQALTAFKRFPTWVWPNKCFLAMVEWLWLHNRRESTLDRVGVYGMDLYSLYHSVSKVIEFLESADPEAAERAKRLYSCFDHSRQDPVRYGRQVRVGAGLSCEQAALDALNRLFAQVSSESPNCPDELFYARQNAELVRSAESYYRNLFNPGVNTWNVRDRHMTETVERLTAHLREQGRPAKIAIWAHNSHIGDDRATEMGWHGQLNIGQLLRERHPHDTFHLGFTTYRGTVMAAKRWDEAPQPMKIRPALKESYEALFHRTGLSSFLLDLRDPRVARGLAEPRLERAIGVVYSPTTERASHYFLAKIPDQFDAVIHFDCTREVEPIDRFTPAPVAGPSEAQL